MNATSWTVPSLHGSKAVAAAPTGLGIVILSSLQNSTSNLASPADHCTSWFDRVVMPNWPQYATTPSVMNLPLEFIHAGPASFSERSALKQADAVVVLLDPGETESVIRLAASTLIEHAVPAIFLLRPNQERFASMLHASGCVVYIQHASDNADQALSSILAAICQRQSHVRELDIELRSRRATQRQVTDWVSKVDNELLLAAKLQRELMRTDDFQAPGITAGVVYRPAWYVSGDVYKLMRIDESTSAILVADAMGHGISAAMYGMTIASGLTMKEIRNANYRLLAPRDALERINQLLLNDDLEVTRFASAICATISVKTGALAVCSAGHPTAYVLDKQGKCVAQLESTGPVLGVFGEAQFDQIDTHLHPGHTLVAVTDGFEEVVGTGTVEAFLSETLAGVEGDPTRAVASIERFLDARPGSLEPGDDCTVLMIRRD
jgi:phosphoserine phosphatase RsbU/P